MVSISYKGLKEIYEGQDADIDTRAFNSPNTIQKEWHREKLRHVLKNSDLKGKVVLDAGCGSGAFDRELEKSARLVVGVDLNKFAVSYATDKAGRRSVFSAGNIEELPLKAGSVDVAVCLDALDHCLKPKGVVKEFSRVLRPGGRLVLIAQNHTMMWRLVEKLWDMFGEGREYGHVHVSRFDMKNIGDVFKGTGLDIEKLYSIHNLSPLVVKKKPWNYPEAVEKRLRTKGWGFSIVAVARKA